MPDGNGHSMTTGTSRHSRYGHGHFQPIRMLETVNIRAHLQGYLKTTPGEPEPRHITFSVGVDTDWL